jgi:hypothetical protein
MDRSCIGDELRSQVNYLRQLMKDFKIPLTFSMLTDPKLAIGYSAPRSQGLRKQMTTVTAAAQAAIGSMGELAWRSKHQLLEDNTKCIPQVADEQSPFDWPKPLPFKDYERLRDLVTALHFIADHILVPELSLSHECVCSLDC